MNFSFTIKYTSPNNHARLGEIITPHGLIQTPAFIFCATKAAIKGATPKQLRDAGTQIILSNTYHLMLQPGQKVLEAAGGIQKFTGWNGPMLTDSGGFQIFSLGHGSVASEIKGKRNDGRPKTMLKITEEGAKFRSYISGEKFLLTPEKSIQVQRSIGADLVVCFDECTPFNVEKRYTRLSMERSHRWEERSLNEFNRINTDGSQRLYGIIQGGVYEDLRQESIDFVNSKPFFGHAIGGSLGANKEQMYEIVAFTAPKLEKSRPIHLLGIGGIKDIFNGVKQGIDTFDCVHPTRLARHGGGLVQPTSFDKEDTSKEHINIKKAIYALDQGPIDKNCDCETCLNYSRSYIHHLFRAGEMLGIQLLTIHNIRFMNRLLESIRSAIATDTLDEEEKNWINYQ